jgi:hypothetical protein
MLLGLFSELPREEFFSETGLPALAHSETAGHKQGHRVLAALGYGFCILRHRHPLRSQVSMFFLCGPGARLWGKRERRTGTKLMAVFLQHICSEVNTSKGVVFGLTLIDF